MAAAGWQGVEADLIRDLWERLVGETCGRDLWERLVGATFSRDTTRSHALRGSAAAGGSCVLSCSRCAGWLLCLTRSHALRGSATAGGSCVLSCSRCAGWLFGLPPGLMTSLRGLTPHAGRANSPLRAVQDFIRSEQSCGLGNANNGRYSRHPALRPAGQPAAVQFCSGQNCPCRCALARHPCPADQKNHRSLRRATCALIVTRSRISIPAFVYFEKPRCV